MRYTVVIEQTTRNFSTYVPDLSGCVVTGATREGVIQVMREAIAMHIDGLRERGEPVPETQGTATVVELPQTGF